MLLAIACLLPTSLSAPTPDRVKLLSIYMLQAAGIHFHLLCLFWSHAALHCADLVHDNLALHPLPNHLADAAVAQLIIGGAAGELVFISNDSSLQQRSVTQSLGQQKAATILSWMINQNIRYNTHIRAVSLPSARKHFAWLPCIHCRLLLQLWTGLWRRRCRALASLVFFFLERNRPPCWRLCELVFEPTLHVSTVPSQQSSQIRCSAHAALHLLYRCQLQQRVPHQCGEPGCHRRSPARSRLWAQRCRRCR